MPRDERMYFLGPTFSASLAFSPEGDDEGNRQRWVGDSISFSSFLILGNKKETLLFIYKVSSMFMIYLILGLLSGYPSLPFLGKYGMWRCTR